MSAARTWKPSTSWSPASREVTRQVPVSSASVTGKWGGEKARADLDRVALGGHDHGDVAVGVGAGGEEGQAVGVVPVQVAEQDRPPEGSGRGGG